VAKSIAPFRTEQWSLLKSPQIGFPIIGQRRLHTILDFVFFSFFFRRIEMTLENPSRAPSLASILRAHQTTSRSNQSTIGSMQKTRRKVVEPVLSQTSLGAYLQNTWMALDIEWVRMRSITHNVLLDYVLLKLMRLG
jgi:hypothetical protein